MNNPKGTLFQPTFLFPMATIGVLVGGFLIYYFPITAQQETTLNRRAFRSLAAVSDGITSRVLNCAEVLRQSAKGTSGDAAAGPRDVCIPRKADAATDTAPSTACPPDRITVSTTNYQLALRCDRRAVDVAIDRMVPQYLNGLPEQLFDGVVLTDADGVVLFQSIATGTRISSLRPASAATGAPASGGTATPAPATFAAGSQSSTLMPLVIAGEEYKLYLVPVALKMTAATPAASRLVVGGLMRARRFRAQSLALPGAALVTATLLVLVATFGGWARLKFVTMRPTERLPRRSAAYLFLSPLATIILLCILAIHVRYVYDQRAVDLNLERLADRISGNLATEAALALRVLESANNSAAFAATVDTPAKPDCKQHLSTDTELAHTPQKELLTVAGLRLSDYPYFDRIFWIDSRGYQHIKWEAAVPTSATPVGDRAYFVETVANHLWQLAPPALTPARFRIDPVLSRNTGEYLAAISEKAPKRTICGDVDLSVVSMVTPLLSLIDPIMPPDYGFAIVDPKGNVLFHSTSTKNLQERFLDELDDASGVRVALFARQGTLLNARYLGLDHRLFVTPVRTLADSPWSLIVFHNLANGASQHFERIVLFSILALTYYAGLAVVILFFVPASKRPQAWMWPRLEARGSYLHLTLALALIAISFYWLLFAVSRPTSTLVIIYILPLVTLAMVAIKLRPASTGVARAAFLLLAGVFLVILYVEPQSKLRLLVLLSTILAAAALLPVRILTERLAQLERPSLTNSYAALWASVLMVVALLPCIGFFRIAFDYHANLSTRRLQVETMSALADREERIKAQYGKRALTTGSMRDRIDVDRWLFVRRRLEQTLDRYDAVLLGSNSGQLISRAADNGADSRGIGDPACDQGLPTYVRAVAWVDPYGTGELTRTLVDSSTQSMWSWCREGLNRLRLRGRIDASGVDAITLSLPPARALNKALTADPVFLYPELVSELPMLEPWGALAVLAIFGITAAVTFWWLKPTLEQLFLLEVQSTDPLPEIALDKSTPLDQNLILLTFDRNATSEALRSRSEVKVIDFAEIMRGTVPDYAAMTEQVIAIDHFDYSSDDDQAHGKRLELLERLLSLYPRKTVVIVSTLDPVFFFEHGPEVRSWQSYEALAPGRDMERWAAVLRQFTRRRVDHARPGTMLERGRAVWSACTTAERVALYQIAHDGWVNPRNQGALQQLQLRGLISGKPFTFCDSALEEFISRTITGKDRRSWEQHDVASAWDGIRLVFVVVILGIAGAAFFVNQQSALGLVATSLGVLTPVSKLLTEANSFRSLLFGKAVKP